MIVKIEALLSLNRNVFILKNVRVSATDTDALQALAQAAFLGADGD